MAVLLALAMSGCGPNGGSSAPGGATATPSATTSPPPQGTGWSAAIAPGTRVRLVFILIQKYGPPSYCGPPVVRNDYPLGDAQRALPELANDPIFTAILEQDQLPAAAALSDAQLSQEYTKYLNVTHANLQPGAGDSFTFSGFVSASNGQDAQSWSGTISSSGAISGATATAPARMMCPICLAATTRILTESGAVPVPELKVGDSVLTSDGHGGAVSVRIARVGHTYVGLSHHVVHLVLSDGRSVDVSPGHPTADGRTVGALHSGEHFDGSTVASATLTAYPGTATYDLLPEGPTGTYWADGVLLASTLH